jgi:hypothetical protein
VTVNVATFKLLATKFSIHFFGAGIMWFIASAVADLLITVSLIWSLVCVPLCFRLIMLTDSLQHKRRSSHHSTNVSVNRIVRLTVQTGLITTVFAICDLLFFTISPASICSIQSSAKLFKTSGPF